MRLRLLLLFSVVVFLGCSKQIVSSEPAGYKDMNAKAKQVLLWEQILKTKYSTLPKLEDANVILLLTKSLRAKMDHDSDFAPRGWNKAIHKRAVVAKFKYVPKVSRYNGVFSRNGVGIIRISLTYRPEDKGVAPGIALKFLLSNRSSANISLLTSLDSQGQDYNIFRKKFSNVIKPSSSLSGRIVSYLFSRTGKKANSLSLSKFGPKAPHQIFLVARDTNTIESNNKVDFRVTLQDSKFVNLEFDVFADDINRPIGTIVIDSKFIASEFGDTGIFFKHDGFEESD